jgi:hypothetical protein
MTDVAPRGLGVECCSARLKPRTCRHHAWVSRKLAGTTLAASRTTWTALCTNCFDTKGNYSFAVALTPSTTQFYLMAIRE